MTPVTLLISRRVSPSRHAAFLDWMRAGAALAAGFQGFLGHGLFTPPAGSDEHQVVFRFADPASLAAWERSAARELWLGQGTDWVQHGAKRCARGLENWFGMTPPPRWKQAVSIWLVFFPVSLLFSLSLGPQLNQWPVFWRVLASTLLMTPVMVFYFIPLSQKLLRPWLYRAES